MKIIENNKLRALFLRNRPSFTVVEVSFNRDKQYLYRT